MKLTSWQIDAVLGHRCIKVLNNWQADILHERHRVHLDLRRHLVDHRLRHLLQLAQNHVRRLLIQMLHALVLQMVWSVASVQLRHGPLVILNLAVRVLLLLILLVENDSLLAGILFGMEIQFKINFHAIKHRSTHVSIVGRCDAALIFCLRNRCGVVVRWNVAR